MSHKNDPPARGEEGLPASGVSRRRFMQGVGGLVGASAVMGPGLLRAQQTQGPPMRAGIRRVPADGAEITLRVNGEARRLTVTPNTTLLDAMREQAQLTGCKEVCNRGACGACTMLLDGRSINSCLTLAVDAVGHEVTTVEGLVKGDQLDPVQQAFADHDACQCGYCIPGFVVRSRALIDEFPNPSLDQVKHGLSGNICRCAAYIRIFEAVQAAGRGGVA